MAKLLKGTVCPFLELYQVGSHLVDRVLSGLMSYVCILPIFVLSLTLRVAHG